MYCNRCGKEISDQTRICDCGNELEEVTESSQVANQNISSIKTNSYLYSANNKNQTQNSNGMGIAGFILGLLSVVLFCIFYISLPSAIIGIILSIVQMNKSKSGLAISGLVLSSVGLIIAGIIIILAILISVGIIIPPQGFPSYQ